MAKSPTSQIKASGFTLIELLVVFAIISVFTGLSIAYFNQFTDQKKVESESRKLMDVLELAKKKSSTTDIPPTQPPNTSFCLGNFQGYHVTVTPTDYTLYINCSLNQNGGLAQIAQYTFGQGIASADDEEIDFPASALNSMVTLSPGQGVRIWQASNHTNCVMITINSVGTIDSQACP